MVKPYILKFFINMPTNLKENSNKNNAVSKENFENHLTDIQKQTSQSGASDILSRLLLTRQKIEIAAGQEVVLSPAIISRYDPKSGETIGIFRKGTINVIQGKTGTHKSRFAELLCSLLLQTLMCVNNFLEFMRFADEKFTVVYIDTERNQKEAVPLTIQNIREKAGHDKTIQVDNFYTFSIKEFSREERMTAVQTCLEYVQKETKQPLFIVLDVVTDCVKSFNNDTDSLKLYDHLGNMCDDLEATFLLLIHENPGSEKARGHTGTEAAHKADVVIQIGYDNENDNKDLLKLRFLKHRNAARPDPIYIKYSKEAKGLILADAEEVKEAIESKIKSFDSKAVVEFLEELLIEPKEMSQVNVALKDKFNVGDRTITSKISELIESKIEFYNKDAKKCLLTRDKDPKDKRQTVLKLVPLILDIQTELDLETLEK